jgi:hypothetical protein
MNIGYFLTNSGNFPALCTFNGPPPTPNPACGINYLGAQGVYNAQSSNMPNAPTNQSFLSNGLAIEITALGAYGSKNYANNNPYSGNLSNAFGYYDASQTTVGGATASEVTIYGPGQVPPSLGMTDTFVPAYGDYGFWITVCQSTVLVSGIYDCTSTNTYFSNALLNPAGETDHQHFALFTTTSDPNIFFLGVNDKLNNDAIEGYGDFQDVVVRISTIPEPATFGFVGVGLVGLFMAMHRRRRQMR